MWLINALNRFQGPCTGNQQSLAHSRLWDAVVGFLHVFAHMQMKLSQVAAVYSALFSSHSGNQSSVYTFMYFLTGLRDLFEVLIVALSAMVMHLCVRDRSSVCIL